MSVGHDDQREQKTPVQYRTGVFELLTFPMLELHRNIGKGLAGCSTIFL